MVEITRRRNRPPGRERELRAMLELSGAGMALAEPLTGRFTDVNGTFCEITGYGADELLGLTFRDITHPDDRQRDVESFERVLRGETDRWTIEKRYLRKDGGIRWVLVSGRLLRDEKGRPARTVAIVQDITEQKEAEEALREANRKLTTTLESVTDGFVTLDREWRHTHVSQTAARLLHRSREELLGRVAWEVFPEAVTLRFFAECNRAVADNVAVHFEEFYPDPLNTWYECHCYPSAEGLSVFFTDVTARRQVEAERRRLLAQMDALLDQMPAGLIIVEAPSGRILRANRQMEEIWRHPILLSGDVSTAEWRAFHADGRPYAPAERPVVRSITQGEVVVNEEIDIERGDLTRGTILVNSAPIRDRDGQIFAGVVAALDITEMRNARREAEEGRAILQAVMEHVPEGLTIVDASGNFRMVSRYMERMVGRPLEELTSRPVPEHVGTWGLFRKDGVSPPAEHELPMIRALRRGEVVAGEELLLKRQDGTSRVVLASTGPIRDAGGRIAGAVAAWRDVTEQKRVAERDRMLMEAAGLLGQNLSQERILRELVRLVVTHMADWSVIDLLDDEGRPRRVAGAHRDPAKEALVQALVAYPAPENTPAAEALRTRKAVVLPAMPAELLERAARDSRHLELMRELDPRSMMAVPLTSRDRAIGVIAFVSSDPRRPFSADDLPLAEGVARRAALAVDNARLYQQAQEANRLKDEFLATLSHELRTPLNAILGWSQLLLDAPLDAPTSRRAIEAVNRNAQAQRQLIDEVLDVSRIMSGKLALNMAAVDLASLLDKAFDSVRPAAEAKRIELVPLVAASLPSAFGDPDRLQQVLWNLLSNAVKFTPAGGRVEVRLDRHDSQIRLSVSDNGVGISPDFLPRLFERFAQVDSSTRRQHGGLGLGLALVRHLVELHGGTVSAESAGPGLGATFTVLLPVRAVDRPPEPVSRETRPGPHAPFVSGERLSGLLVLVVDDEADARDLVETELRQSGADVVTAASAAEGLGRLEERQPDVIIADIGMPGEDGYDFIRKVRELPPDEGGATPAAALTAYGGAGDRLRALAAGYHLHIPKPVLPEELIEVVAALARGRRRDPLT